MKVDDFIEKEGSACCPRKPRGDQLVPVGEEGVALRACEETTSADVFQVNAAHIIFAENVMGKGMGFWEQECVQSDSAMLHRWNRNYLCQIVNLGRSKSFLI